MLIDSQQFAQAGFLAKELKAVGNTFVPVWVQLDASAAFGTQYRIVENDYSADPG